MKTRLATVSAAALLIGSAPARAPLIPPRPIPPFHPIPVPSLAVPSPPAYIGGSTTATGS